MFYFIRLRAIGLKLVQAGQAIHSTVTFIAPHTFACKFWIRIEMLYRTFNLIFSWFVLVRFEINLYHLVVHVWFHAGKLLRLHYLNDVLLNLGRTDIVNAIRYSAPFLLLLW
jgi:hypothetical protein